MFMGIFDKFTDSLGRKAGLKVAQIGSNKLIARYTDVDLFLVNKQILSAADDFIEQQYSESENDDVNGFLNEEEAALLKLSFLRGVAENNDDYHMGALLEDALSIVRDECGKKIRPAITLLALSI